MKDQNAPYWFISERGIKSDYIYFIRFNKWLKIGVTSDLVQRFNSIRFALPEECFLIGFFKTEKAGLLEQVFIEDMKTSYNERGEWVLWNESIFNDLVAFWSNYYKINLIKNDEQA